jgi:hypothetical protein
MEQSKYRSLVEESGIYPYIFIKEFGSEGPHWLHETWYKRELSLRHDMCCTLLCNQQLAKEVEEALDGQNLGQHLESIAELMEEDLEIGIPAKEDNMVQERADDFLEDQEKMKQSVVMEMEERHRFQLLEGMSILELLQNQFCAKHGIPQFNSTFDIIDEDLKKLIEVKVTMDRDRAILAYEEKSRGNTDNTALVIIDPNDFTVEYINHPGDFNGEPKVRGFLASRKLRMNALNILESKDTADEVQWQTTFCDDGFNNLVKQFADQVGGEAVTRQLSKNFDKPVEKVPDAMKPSQMIKLIKGS